MEPTQIPRQKTCTSCGLTKPADAFYRNSRTRDGLTSWCRECTKEQARHRRTVRRATRVNIPGPWRLLPEKQAILAALKKAVIENGLVVPSKCSMCGLNARIFAYWPPLATPDDVAEKVQWLCSTCHAFNRNLDASGEDNG